MHTYKIGDNVSVLDEETKGMVKAIHQNHVVIEDEHGFELSFPKGKIVPYKSAHHYKLTDQQIEQAINDKQDEKKLLLKDKNGSTSTHHFLDFYEIDLHIEALTANYHFMDETEMLLTQLRYCRIFIEKAIRTKQKKALLIHGKGAGVLRNEIHSYLERLESHKHIHLDFKVVNNGGATEVYFL
jgi:hypothetical protein